MQHVVQHLRGNETLAPDTFYHIGMCIYNKDPLITLEPDFEQIEIVTGTVIFFTFFLMHGKERVNLCYNKIIV